MKKFFLLSFILVLTVLPVVVLADDDDGNGPGTSGSAVEIKNPIASPDLQNFIKDILEIVVTVATPFLVVMIIYAGFRYVWARGDVAEVKKAHDIILWTVVGATIILGAYIIAAVIEATINQLKAGTSTAYVELVDRQT